MKKRILAVLLTGILIFTQTAPAFAADISSAEIPDGCGTIEEGSPDEEQTYIDTATEEPDEGDSRDEEPAVDDTGEGEPAAEGALDEEEPAIEEGREEEDLSESTGDVPELTDAEETDDAVNGETTIFETEPEKTPAIPVIKKDRRDEGESLISLPADWFRLFDDGVLELPINTEQLGDPAHHFEVTLGIWDDETDQPKLTDLVAENDGYSITGDTLKLYGDRIVSAFEGAGYDYALLWIDAYIEGQEESAADAFAYLELRHSEYEPIFRDRSMLVGWDEWIERDGGYSLRNQEHPDGGWEDVAITAVELDEEGRDVIRIEEREDGWRLFATKYGTAEVTLTYIDYDGTERTQSYCLFVGGDVFSVNLDSADRRHSGLPGDEIELLADADHEFFDEEGNYQNTTEGFSYEWGVEVGEGYASLLPDTEDPSRAVLKLRDLEAGETELDEEIRVFVKIRSGDSEVAKDTADFRISTVYEVIEPTDLNRGLDIGGSVTETFNVRRYRHGSEGETISDVTFRWEDYDENAVHITETVDGEERQVERGIPTGGNTFTITRLADYGTDLRIVAEWKEGDEDREIDCHYRFDNKNYDIHFDEHDRDVFRGSGEVQARLNIGSLGDNWEDRFRIHITLGSWTDDMRTGDDWDDEEGWIEKVDERDLDGSVGPYYSYAVDGDDIVFTFTEELLRSLDDIRVRADVYTGGSSSYRVSDTDAWLHMRDEEYDDYFGDENLFPGETRYIRADCGDTLRVRNARYPDDAWLRIVITDVRVESDEDMYDTRDAVIVRRDADGWEFEAVRGGYADVTLTMDLYDGDTKAETREQTFRYWVGDFRAWIDLQPVSGSFDMLPGTDTVVTMNCGAEHQDQNGNREEADVSGKKIRWEVRAEWIDDEWLRHNDVSWEEAREMGRFWTASVNGQNLVAGTWYQDDNPEPEAVYYCETMDHDAKMTISASADAPPMNLHVRAILIDRNETDPDDEWQIADTHRFFKVTYDTYMLELADQWDPGLPAGGTVTLNPSVVKYTDGVPSAMSDEEQAAVHYRLEWEERSGDIYSDDAPDVIIRDYDGRTLTYNEEGGDRGTAPFSVQRITDWNMGFELIAYVTEGDAEHEIARRSFRFDPFDPEVELEASPRHGNEYATTIYTNETLTIAPTLDKLSALKDAGYPVEWSLSFGEWEWSEEEGHDVLVPIRKYEIGEDGRRIDGSGEEFHFNGEELDSTDGTLTISGGDRMEELFDILRYQNDEWGNRGARFEVYFEASIYAVPVCRRNLRVLISKAEKSLEDDGMTVLTTDRFYYDGGHAMLYVEDFEHCGGNETDDLPGSYYDVSISKIESSDESVLKPYEEDGNWYIEGMKPGDAEITYTYMGGPEGDSGTHTTKLYVSNDWYKVEVPSYYNMLLGEQGTIVPKLIHIGYDANAEGDPYIREEVDPTAQGLEIYFEYWDDRMIDLDERSGAFSALRTGESDLFAGIRYEYGDARFDDGQWVHIDCSTSRGVLPIDAEAKVYAAPGDVIRISDARIRSALPETMLIQSVRNPEGVPEQVAEYYYDGGDRRLEFASSVPDGPLDTMTVPAVLAAQVENGAALPLQIDLYGIAGGSEERRAYGSLSIVVHNHAEDEGSVTKAPTCKEAGVKTFRCSICGEILRTEEVAASGHGSEISSVTKATLAADGRIETKCSLCGDVLRSTVISRPAGFKLAATSYIYGGKAKTPAVTVTDAAGKAIDPSGYAVSYVNNVNAGTATAKVVFKGNYTGGKSLTFTITKAANTMKVTAKKPTVKYTKLKKKKQSIKTSKAFAVKGANGKVTYKKKKGNKKITVAANGKITLEKGLKKKTYKITVLVNAAGDANHKAASKKVVLKITVK